MLRTALACAGLTGAVVLSSATAAAALTTSGTADERCANAFVLEQITSQYSAGDAGRFLVYEFASGQAQPNVAFSLPAPVITSNGLYLCERGLFVTSVMDVRLKPQVSRLVFNEVKRGAKVEEPSWWQRLLGLQPKSSKHHMTDRAPGQVFNFGDRVVIFDNAIDRLPAASAPAGWHAHAPWRHASGQPGPPTEVNIFSKPGQPMIPVTYLVHFDPAKQRQLARVPLSMNCSFSGGSPPFYASCFGDFVELDILSGARRLVAKNDDMRAVETGAGFVGTPHRASGRMLRITKQVLSATEAVPLDLFGLIDEPGRPGGFERLGPVPSRTIRSAQGTPWGLMMVSAQERKAWLYDPNTRSAISAPLPLLEPSGEIAAISHTRDHILVAEVTSLGDGRASTRLHLLDTKLRVLQTLELPGRTNSIVTSARPWKAVNYMDDFHLVVYPNEVPKAARQ